MLDTEMVWRQFAAAIDMLESALCNCPDELWTMMMWEDEPDQWVAAGFSSFWYVGYHTLFWLDLYLTGAEEGFAPPAPFDLVEMESGEVLPRTYTRAELLQYTDYCRTCCRTVLLDMTQDDAYRLCRFPWGEMPFLELQLRNLRHVQEHAAHLHMFLGQQARPATRSVADS